jgi:hypothetical protein
VDVVDNEAVVVAVDMMLAVERVVATGVIRQVDRLLLCDLLMMLLMQNMVMNSHIVVAEGVDDMAHALVVVGTHDGATQCGCTSHWDKLCTLH